MQDLFLNQRRVRTYSDPTSSPGTPLGPGIPFVPAFPCEVLKNYHICPHFTIRDPIKNFGKGTKSLKTRDAHLWALSAILSWWSKIPRKTLRKGNNISLSTTFVILYIRRVPQQLNSNFSL